MVIRPFTGMWGYVAGVGSRFVAERAIAPRDGAVSYVVIDEFYEVHSEASAYLAWLRSSDRSPNTERVYSGRVAFFLTYCAEARLDWRTVTTEDLTRFLHDLVRDPITPTYGTTRFRSNKTANAIFTSVCEFLKFSVARGWVEFETVDALSRPKFLRFVPPGYDLCHQAKR
jgi:integrase/recombinase XerD